MESKMKRINVISRHIETSQQDSTANNSQLARELCGWVIVNVTREDCIDPKHSLKGKTVFITGGSRGIGLAIGIAAGREGANVVLAAKTTDPQPNLEGTIFTAAAEVEKAGGKALAVKCDVRDEKSVEEAIKTAVDKFGGIDILVNNASAISMTGTLETSMKKYDLLHSVDGRATFLVSQKCIPHLLESAKKGRNPHIMMISPPLDMDQRWFLNHTAYSAAKMTMSMHVLGLSGEFKESGIAVNALWPRTAVATAAVQNVLGGSDMMETSRSPEIMADAAMVVLKSPSKTCTGKFFIDDIVLMSVGMTLKEMEKYHAPGVHLGDLTPDFFI